MKGYYWKVETILPAGTLLLLVCLFASISITPSEYLDCRSLFPDENLDFSGISKAFETQSPASSVSTLVASQTNHRHSRGHPLPFEMFSPQSIYSGMALATIMRC